MVEEYNFKIIQPHEVDNWWGKCYKALARAVNRPTSSHTMNNVYDMAKENRLSICVIIDNDYKVAAAATIQLVPYPNEKMVRIIHLGGWGIKKWGPLFADSMRELRIQVGATQIEAFCRKGFERVFREWGFNPTHTIMRGA